MEIPERWLRVKTRECTITYIEKYSEKELFRVAIGTTDHPTPTGIYRIIMMSKDPESCFVDSKWPAGVFGTRLIELSVKAFDFDSHVWRSYAIHGTDDDSKIPGRNTYGCIRLKNADLEKLYEYCQPGMMVMII